MTVYMPWFCIGRTKDLQSEAALCDPPVQPGLLQYLNSPSFFNQDCKHQRCILCDPPLLPGSLTLRTGMTQCARRSTWGGLGSMSMGSIVQWVTDERVVAVQQFRDNLFVAAQGPGAPAAMAEVCAVMQDVWKSKWCVNAAQRTSLPIALVLACAHRSQRWVCLCILVAGTLVFAHANALGGQWQLKLGVPLQRFWAPLHYRSLAHLWVPYVTSYPSFQRGVAS